METSFYTLGIVMLLAVMLPGADFAIVTKNTLLHSRKAGIFTALGIGAAIWVHMTYCVLGLATVIRESFWIFHAIQYGGALYLLYLGIILIKPHADSSLEALVPSNSVKQTLLSAKKAFRQGFVCNLLNPKATLFFLTLFSTVASKNSSFLTSFAYAFEIFIIAMSWFCLLVYLLTHSAVTPWLNKANKTIEKVLGIVLIGLAVFVFFYS